MSEPENKRESSLPLANEVAKALESMSVHCVALLGERAPDGRIGDGKPSYAVNGANAYWVKPPQGGLVVVFPIDVEVELVKSGGERTQLGHFFVQHQVVYSLKAPLSTWSDAALEAFSAFYGSVHVWPYVRAELQSLTAKVGLPPITLPVLNMGHVPNGFSISQTPPSEAQEEAV